LHEKKQYLSLRIQVDYFTSSATAGINNIFQLIFSFTNSEQNKLLDEYTNKKYNNEMSIKGAIPTEDEYCKEKISGWPVL
jgi:hypothetical protein